MTVIVGSVTAMALTGGAAAPAVMVAAEAASTGAATAAAAGAVTAVGASTAGATAVGATAAGVSAAAGSVSAATLAGGAAAGVVGGTGAVAGAATAAAGTATAAGVAAAEAAVATGAAASTGAGITAGILSGPIGWIVLGTELCEVTADSDARGTHALTQSATFDCWKAVVGETDPTPSSGRYFRDIVADPRVVACCAGGAGEGALYTLTNAWGENYDIVPVVLDEQTTFHAVRVE